MNAVGCTILFLDMSNYIHKQEYGMQIYSLSGNKIEPWIEFLCQA